MQYLPNRTDNMCLQRYRRLLNWKMIHDGVSVMSWLQLSRFKRYAVDNVVLQSGLVLMKITPGALE